MNVDRAREAEDTTGECRPDGTKPAWFAFVPWLTLLIAAGYLLLFVNRHWMPHDEGTLSHSAERVVAGQVPHREFDDAYTGGLSYWNALSYKILGVRLSSIRWLLFLTALPWLGCIYWIAARRTNAIVAAVLTWTATVWSLPNYFAALPSWYLLLFGTFGIVAVIRYRDAPRNHLLWLAGFWGGMGMLFKIHALFYIGGVLLYLPYHLHHRRGQSSAPVRPPHTAWRLTYQAFVSLGVVVFLTLVLLLIRRHLRPMELLTYIAPIGLLCAVSVTTVWRRSKTDANPCKDLLRLVGVFVGGVLTPIVLFVAFFGSVGALDDLYRGVLVLPQRFVLTAGSTGSPSSSPAPDADEAGQTGAVPGLERFVASASSHALPSTLWILPAVPVGLLIMGGFLGLSRWDRPISYAVAIGAGLLLASLAVALSPMMRLQLGVETQAWIYRVICFSARSLLPIVLCWVAVVLLLRKQHDDRIQETFLLAIVTAVMSLIQYPYATVIYFFYVAPLAALVIEKAVALQPQPLKRTLLALLTFYLIFGIGWLNTGYNRSHGSLYLPASATVPLGLPRGGIRVPANDQRIYATVVQTIQQHTGNDESIIAGPDCPEIYFLAHRTNPTRALFDLFVNPQTQAQQFISFLEQHQINLVVINRVPEFSVPVGPELDQMLRARFPQALQVDRFTIRWREKPSE